MLRVAGELSDGAITWLAGLRTLGETIVPTLHDVASSAGRPQPRVVAGLPVAVTDDPDHARADAQTRFARYGGLENYRRVFEREGVNSVADLAIVGNEADVRRQLQRYADTGVTELWPGKPLGLPGRLGGQGAHPLEDLARCIEGDQPGLAEDD